VVFDRCGGEVRRNFRGIYILLVTGVGSDERFLAMGCGRCVTRALPLVEKWCRSKFTRPLFSRERISEALGWYL
jgi:hypothetical protein